MKSDELKNKIEELVREYEDCKELLDSLIDIEITWDNLNWLNFNEPHHFTIEIPRVILEVQNRIQEIENVMRVLA